MLAERFSRRRYSPSASPAASSTSLKLSSAVWVRRAITDSLRTMKVLESAATRYSPAAMPAASARRLGALFRNRQSIGQIHRVEGI
jgi:hypothetical protein